MLNTKNVILLNLDWIYRSWARFGLVHAFGPSPAHFQKK